jgi:hypothetical protein
MPAVEKAATFEALKVFLHTNNNLGHENAAPKHLPKLRQ